MATNLSNDEQFLLDCVTQGEAGLVRYGEKQLEGSLLWNKGDAYVWDETKRLWVPMNSSRKSTDFFTQTFHAIQDLMAKIDRNTDERFKAEKPIVLSLLKKAISAVTMITKMNGIWNHIQTLLVSEHKLNDYSDELPLKGGKKINLRTGEISDRTCQDIWTYEIEATGVECSEQDKADNLKYFEKLCLVNGEVDRELLDYLQRLCGYWMTFEVSDKAFYLLVGVSDCGKSHLIKRFQTILRQRVTPCSRDVFVRKGNGKIGDLSNHQTYLLTLTEPVSLVYLQELGEGNVLNSEVVKSLTGDDLIKFRGAYDRKEKGLEVRCKIVIGSNLMPMLNGGDDGLKTRLRRIPFQNKHVGDHIPRAEKIANEEMLSRLDQQGGINATFAWWLEGARKVLSDFEAGERRLEVPNTIKEVTNEFLSDTDSFKHFLETCCHIWNESSGDKKEDYKYSRSALQSDFKTFCDSFDYNGIQRLSKSQIVDRIRQRFPWQKERGDWIGIRSNGQLLTLCM